ncbi:MAG: hypothetical protein ABUL69_01330, partial [Peristeroidobacter soli]
MIRKAFIAAALLAFAGGAQAATDYPSGYTKCAKEGETCSFTGTRSVAYGKAGTFVYANITGPFTCAASRFPSISVDTPRYCSYGAVVTPPACPATTIGPVINGSSTSSATVASGASVAFSPTPTSGGSWAWSGCGTSGTSRTQTVFPTASCSATATYTNSCGTQSTRSHTITVNGTTPPSTPSGTPIGFGRSTTGGAGGTTVTVTTGTQLNQALCGRASVSTPIIIRVNGTINHGNTTKVSGSCDTTATEVQFKCVSNVTLIGVGSSGVLDQIGVHIRNSSNIIVRNLCIKNVKKSG